MSALRRSARVVVVGAGIVRNSLACHLARLGWTGMVRLDKRPLPNPGGSTGHASNFIFPVDHSREMTALTVDSVRQYRALDVFTECGGIEVARSEERLEELRRRVASARAWGLEPVALLTPEEVNSLVPYIDESVILAAGAPSAAGQAARTCGRRSARSRSTRSACGRRPPPALRSSRSHARSAP